MASYFTKLGNRGVMVTVASILLLPIYSGGIFDIWDFLIALVGISFGLSAAPVRLLLPKVDSFLIAFILATSISLIAGVWSDGGIQYSYLILSGDIAIPDPERGDGTSKLVMRVAFIGTIILSFVLSVIPRTKFDLDDGIDGNE